MTLIYPSFFKSCDFLIGSYCFHVSDACHTFEEWISRLYIVIHFLLLWCDASSLHSYLCFVVFLRQEKVPSRKGILHGAIKIIAQRMSKHSRFQDMLHHLIPKLMSANSAREKVPRDWDRMFCFCFVLCACVMITHHVKQLVALLGELKTLLIQLGPAAICYICA